MEYKLLIHRNGSSVHLKPVGAFSPGLARELAETQELFARRGMRLIVHTSGVDVIDPEALEEYRDRAFHPEVPSSAVIFTGEMRDVFLP